MAMKVHADTFSTYHPLINFLYFAIVLVLTMFVLQPVFLVISIVAAISYAVYLNRGGAVKFNLLGMLPLFILMVVINPVFNHAGVTILVYVNGNPGLSEAIVYGIVAATMFIAVMNWFSCYNAIMTSDKFIYLFGKVIPRLSLVLSMILRFVPKYKAQIKKISMAQRCIGRDMTNGNLLDKAKNGIKILSIPAVTLGIGRWDRNCRFHAIQKVRLPGRTGFFHFPFRRQGSDDAWGSSFLASMALSPSEWGRSLSCIIPRLRSMNIRFFAVVSYIFTVFYVLPLITIIVSDIKWYFQRHSISEEEREAAHQDQVEII